VNVSAVCSRESVAWCEPERCTGTGMPGIGECLHPYGACRIYQSRCEARFVRHCSYYSGLNVKNHIYVHTPFPIPAPVGTYPVYRFVGSLQQYSSSPGRAGEMYGQWYAGGWGMDAELIDTCVREKFTKYHSPLGSWHLSVSAKVSLAVS
jgi:hypothetical protein